MPSVRLTLIAPAVWLSNRLNFAWKYSTLGVIIGLVGAYLAPPLFEQTNKEVAMAKMELEGVQLIARQNQIFLQLVRLRGELATHDKALPSAQTASITAAIDEMLRNSRSREKTDLDIALRRAWGQTLASDPSDKLDTRFATLNMAINSLLAHSRESARNYRLNLDSELDAAFDMMANRLPVVIDFATKQNHVIQWDLESMAAVAASAHIILKEAMPTLRAGVRQLAEHNDTLDPPQDGATRVPLPVNRIADKATAPLVSKLQHLRSGLLLQQDRTDEVTDASGAARMAAKGLLDALALSNVDQGQALLINSAIAAQSILQARIERLYKDRARLTLALIGSGLLITYMLYAFYIGVLISIKALSRGTNAFCTGQRDVRITLKTADELSLVALNFNTMAQEAERLVQMIEEQTQTRERDLKVLVDALGDKNDELYAVNQRVHEELNLARSVQLAILPNQFPDEHTWAAHACMYPARELGGDFYDCFALPDGRYGVLVADVSGKGVGAAFFMAVSRTVLQDSALSVRTPSQMLAIANDLLCARNPMDLFVTACYGLFDPKDGSFEYASAGHHPPMLRRTTGSVHVLPTTNDMALGVLQGMEYQEHRTRLFPGDTLLMYTDGVTEAFSPQEIAYGEARLLSWFADCPAQCGASSLVNALVSDVARFVDGAEASDDLTCLILCNKRPSEHDLDFVL